MVGMFNFDKLNTINTSLKIRRCFFGINLKRFGKTCSYVLWKILLVLYTTVAIEVILSLVIGNSYL